MKNPPRMGGESPPYVGGIMRRWLGINRDDALHGHLRVWTSFVFETRGIAERSEGDELGDPSLAVDEVKAVTNKAASWHDLPKEADATAAHPKQIGLDKACPKLTRSRRFWCRDQVRAFCDRAIPASRPCQLRLGLGETFLDAVALRAQIVLGILHIVAPAAGRFGECRIGEVIDIGDAGLFSSAAICNSSSAAIRSNSPIIRSSWASWRRCSLTWNFFKRTRFSRDFILETPEHAHTAIQTAARWAALPARLPASHFLKNPYCR
jgi:hypothetical protein